jgi:hypothetical protein
MHLGTEPSGAQADYDVRLRVRRERYLVAGLLRVNVQVTANPYH